MSQPRAYYNEIDPFAAKKLRNLIAKGKVLPGVVDERSIVDVTASDLKGFTRVHFFAGIAGWELALQLAGWPIDLPICTGSCPCPPFSQAGKAKSCPRCEGTNAIPHPFKTGVFVCCNSECDHHWYADGRHLWPEMLRLVIGAGIDRLAGEQVASPGGLAWLDGVFAGLEGQGHTCWAADLCSAGIGAGNIRQRLYWASWLGDSLVPRLERHAGHGDGRQGRQEQAGSTAETSRDGGMADALSVRIRSEEPGPPRATPPRVQGKDGQRERVRIDSESGSGDAFERMADVNIDRLEAWRQASKASRHGHPVGPTSGADRHGSTSPHHGGWEAVDWLWCRDGKWRPVESGTFPLADGVPERVARLKAYGNAIDPRVGAMFIQAFMHIEPTPNRRDAAEMRK